MFLYGGEWSVGDADCHSQCAHWPRNDTVFCKECGTKPGGRTETSAPTEVQQAGDRKGRPYGVVIDGAVCGGTHESRPTGHFCRAGPACPAGSAAQGRRAGKSAKRRRWRMQRAGFEEVPRLADTTVAGNRLARRWAREPRPYGEVARGAGKESPSHGFAVPALFRQGGREDGGCGLPQPVCALASQ